MNRKRFLATGCAAMLLGGCLLLSAGCKKKEAAAPVRLINVQLQPVEKKPQRPYIQAVGTLNAYEEVTVSAEVEGLVREIKVSEGAGVTKGTVLARIDETDYALERRRTEAALKQTEATLANTQQEFRRKEALYKEQLVTSQQFEDVSTRLALADAEVDRAKAALSLAQQKLSKTRVVSPISCVVKEKKVSSGDYVKNGTPLFSIIQCNPIKLYFTLRELDVGKLKQGQEVSLKVDAFPDREFRGKVNIIYPNLDERTRTLKVEALVPNSDGRLKPGLFAKVTLYTGDTREILVVPITSLLYEADKVRVFTVSNDTASERAIKVGNKYGEVMEVVEGLQEGEKVVIAGQQNLSHGVKIKIQMPARKDQQPAEQGTQQQPAVK